MRSFVMLLLLSAAALPAFAAPAQKEAGAAMGFRTPGPGLPFILLDARVGGADLPLLLDTGDALPFELVLAPEAAERAGSSPRPGQVFVSRAAIGGVPVSVQLASNRPLDVGPVHLGDAFTGISPAVDVVSAALGEPVAGILGYEFLRNRVVAIDYVCRRIDLAAAPPGRRPAASLTITPHRPVTLVPVTVNGRGPFRFALDTGARTTILAPATAEAAGLGGKGTFELLGAGGREPAQVLGPARLRVGDAAPVTLKLLASDALARISDEAGARVDGILGAGAFSGGTMTIDYPGRRFWLRPSPRPCPR